MPDKKTIEKARKDKREGKSASTQAGEFVRAEIDKIRRGDHGASSTKQAIAIGLSEARRAGVDLPPPEKGDVKESTRKSAKYAYEAGQGERKPKRQPKVSKAVSKVLEGEPKGTASRKALSRQAKSAASGRTAEERSAAAGKPRRPKASPGDRRQRAKQPKRAPSTVRAFHRFTETAKRSIPLFLRNSGRKTAHTFPGIALAAVAKPRADRSPGCCARLHAGHNIPSQQDRHTVSGAVRLKDFWEV